jgi:hypothetical protein
MVDLPPAVSGGPAATETCNLKWTGNHLDLPLVYLPLHCGPVASGVVICCSQGTFLQKIKAEPAM